MRFFPAPAHHRRPDWALPESAATEESVYLNRRTLLAAGLGAATIAGTTRASAATPGDPFTPKPGRNPDYADAGRPISDEEIASTYNNFYEFGSHKQIWKAAQELDTSGWRVKVDGLVEKESEIDVDAMMTRIPMEERVYRHRCVEAWSMVVPWIGFPLRRLIEQAKPLGSAKYVRFETFLDPSVASGQKQSWYPWPYVEGLTMQEATNDLAFIATGVYGKVLPKQFGAPLRLHLPWKYGFKSIKSIARISFVEERPVSFWEDLQDREYGFWANVNPEVSHPRWTQATEKPLGQDNRIPTLLYNGYAEQVAGMYGDLPEEVGERFWR